MNFYSFGYPIICQKERGSDTLFKIAHFLNNGATSLGLKPAKPQPMGVTRKCFCGFDFANSQNNFISFSISEMPLMELIA